jgi:hypothetical protein
MERYEEGALRSDAAYVRQRHLCVHCPIGLRFMELEKRKPCLYQQRELREIILSIRCTHTRCRGENIVRTHSEARSLRPRGGGRITIPRVCTTGDTRATGGSDDGLAARLYARTSSRHAPARGRRADRASRAFYENKLRSARFFSRSDASRSRRGLSGGERAESGRRIVDRARRGRGGGLGRLPLRREAPARANGGERAAVAGRPARARVKALDAVEPSWEPWKTNGRQRAAAPQRAARNGLRRREGFGRAEC